MHLLANFRILWIGLLPVLLSAGSSPEIVYYITLHTDPYWHSHMDWKCCCLSALIYIYNWAKLTTQVRGVTLSLCTVFFSFGWYCPALGQVPTRSAGSTSSWKLETLRALANQPSPGCTAVTDLAHKNHWRTRGHMMGLVMCLTHTRPHTWRRLRPPIWLSQAKNTQVSAWSCHLDVDYR
jgi:hypothetical protein